MTDSITIAPLTGALNGAIRPPGSKSITNRALVLAAFARGSSVLEGALFSDDTRVMIDSLKRLGIEVEQDPLQQRLVVHGCGGELAIRESDLDVQNSGTTIRFLTAALGVIGGRHRLDGIERMRERPIGPLIKALTSLGANVKTESPHQCPPVSIDSPRLSGGQVSIEASLSSQYLSGLLMAAPLASEGLAIALEGRLVSQPYVEITLRMMESFGVQCHVDNSFSRFTIAAGQQYIGCHFDIEPDASAASYFWAAAAICGGRATVKGLSEQALQGDVRFVNVLRAMGCQVFFSANQITVVGPARHGIDVDMGNISDTVQTLAAVAAFVDGPTTIRNVAHNRIKETDRIHFLAVELRKLGLQVDEFTDGLTITPQPLHAATIETYADHRMAMSLALIGLRVPGVEITKPDCVAKTYPNYFADLAAFCKT